MRPSPLAYVGGVIALILPLLLTVSLISPFWSGRFVVLVALAGAGVVALVLVAVQTGDRTAMAALAFLAWCALSTAASHNRTMSFWGVLSWGTGFVYVAALLSLWTLGRLCGERGGRRLIEGGLLASVLLSAVIAVLQAVLDLSKSDIDQYLNRSHGLTGNPVHLAGLLAGGMWLALVLLDRKRWHGAPAVLVVAVGLQLAGARSAFLVVLVVLVAVPLRRPTRALGVGLVLAGFALGTVAGTVHGADTATSRTVGATSDGGFIARTEMWMSSVHAVTDRPLTGAGPGRFQAATSKYRTLRMVRAEGPGRLYVDAHNLVVEYAVTTGIPGLVLLLVFLGLALRGAALRSPLGGFAVAVLLMQLAEPQSVAVTPLALLALGAAAPTLTPRFSAGWLAGCALVGTASTATAGVLAYGFFGLNQARLDFTKPWADVAGRVLPWPQAAEQQARVALLDARVKRRPELVAVALGYRQDAVDRDPAEPGARLNLADLELQLGRDADARAQLVRTLELDPWSQAALNELGRMAVAAGDRAAAVRYLGRSLRLTPDQPAVRELERKATALSS